MRGKGIEPGCLALIIRSTVPENTGRIVKVLGISKQESPSNPRIWGIEFQSMARTLTRGSIEFSREGNIPEPWLRRIDGDDDLSDIDTDITNDNEVTA